MFQFLPQDYFVMIKILLALHSLSMVSLTYDVTSWDFFLDNISSLDFVEGRFFKDATLNTITSPKIRKEMYFHLLDSLAKVHAVDVDGLFILTLFSSFFSLIFLLVAVGLGGYGKKVDPSLADKRVEGGYIARQIKVWASDCTDDGTDSNFCRLGVVTTNLLRQNLFLKWIFWFMSCHNFFLLKQNLFLVWCDHLYYSLSSLRPGPWWLSNG